MKKILCLTLALLLTLSLVSLVGCKQTASDDKTIIVGASPTPHAEILNQVKDALAAEGTRWLSGNLTITFCPTRRWLTRSWTPTTSSTRPS